MRSFSHSRSAGQAVHGSSFTTVTNYMLGADFYIDFADGECDEF